MKNAFTVRLGVLLPNGLQEFKLQHISNGEQYTIIGTIVRRPDPRPIAPGVVALPLPEEPEVFRKAS